MEFHHYSVLLNETIENLNIRPDGIYVDGTLGGGGHSYQILKRLGAVSYTHLDVYKRQDLRENVLDSRKWHTCSCLANCRMLQN